MLPYFKINFLFFVFLLEFKNIRYLDFIVTVIRKFKSPVFDWLVFVFHKPGMGCLVVEAAEWIDSFVALVEGKSVRMVKFERWIVATGK